MVNPVTLPPGRAEARHEAIADRIGNLDEHDRDRLGLPVGCGENRRGAGHDDIRVEGSQFSRNGAILFRSYGRAVFKSHVATFNPAELAQRIAEDVTPPLYLRIVGRAAEPYENQRRLALRARRKRPCGCRTTKRPRNSRRRMSAPRPRRWHRIGSKQAPGRAFATAI